uniref:hypothetical protein n=1 Tax=Pseudomonas sp. K-62 TaxID=76885 RepID=UPI00159EF422|nr:hypothetical protein [Pseudomonas sp. K-62]
MQRVILTLISVLSLSGAAHGSGQAQTKPIVPAPVFEIIQKRCAVCHAQNPSYKDVHAPPNGVLLDTPDEIVSNRQAIKTAAVLTHFMPLNNLTGMTKEERKIIETWSKYN